MFTARSTLNSKIIFFLVILTWPLVAKVDLVLAQPATCNNVVCGGSDQCCPCIGGAVCYNPATHNCLNTNILCGKGLSVCGSSCYDASQYDCCQGNTICQKGSATPSPSASSSTSIPTASPTQSSSSCPAGSCPGLSCCVSNGAPTCFNPQTHKCCDGRVLCGVSDGCCGTTCFDKTLYSCVDGRLVQNQGPITSNIPTPTTTATPPTPPTPTSSIPTASPVTSISPPPPPPQPSSVPSGSFRYDTPVSVGMTPFSSKLHSLRPNAQWGPLHADGTRPYPTNRWWNNLALGDGNNGISPLPYVVKSQQMGLYVCFPRRLVASAYILNVFLQNLGLESVEGLSNRAIVSYDDLSVTMKWWLSGDPSRSMVVPLVRGAPYVTAEYNNLTPLFTSQHAVLSCNGKTVGSSVTGTKFLVTLNNGQTWIIYSSSSLKLTLNTTTLTAGSAFTGVVRVAYLPTAAAESVLDLYKDTYPTGGTVTYTVPDSTPDEALLFFNWAKKPMQAGTTNQAPLLVMALPHHIDIVQNPTIAPMLSFQSIKGMMTGLLGDQWILKENLYSVTWTAPRGIADRAKRDAVIAALIADAARVNTTASDPYFFGKQLALIARLILIADEYGQDQISSSLRQSLKQFIRPWLERANSDPLRYDSTWKGVCSNDGMDQFTNDFGQGWYNDHHFHYGYFIYAAAAIAKRDATWAAQYKDTIESIIRDYANPSTRDPYFPQLRHMDWYDGHSWASGLFDFADGKNQESTSEAVNAYYSVHLYGEAINNPYIRNLGRLLTATEIRSAKKYWHITTGSQIYPEPEFQAHKTIGIVWSNKVDYATWFGANVEFIHCIQMLPFTPISEILLEREWIQEEYPVLSQALQRQGPPLDEGWKGFVYMAHAIIDKEAAWTEAQGLRSYDDGNTKTNTLYWIATRP